MNRETDIRRLTGQLADEDGVVREQSRNELIQRGGHDGLLSGLIKRAGSIAFCTSAHHVLHEMKADGDSVAQVLESLEQSEPAMTAPPAAYKALMALNEPLDVA